MSSGPRQLSLFGDDADDQRPTPPRRKRGALQTVAVAAAAAELAGLREQLPAAVYLGTSTWSFPGWQGIVYDREASSQTLARRGLAAYAKHPLLTAVGLDRTYYGPIDADAFAAYAEQVPASFRFLVKAHEACTTIRYPRHSRYGARAGEANESFLDPRHASEQVVLPMRRGLGARAGPLVFQCMPQALQSVGGALGFAERVHAFLEALPQPGLYAVEVRNKELLGAPFRTALEATGAAPCLTVHPTMPPIAEQAAFFRLERAPALVIRWMLGGQLGYAEALAAFEPFDALRQPDPQQRRVIADLLEQAIGRAQPAFVIVNNKAEGSAPLSVIELARELLQRRR